MTLALMGALASVLTATACAVPGMHLVVRDRSMMVDAIGHAILPGIAIGYLIAGDAASPLLLLGGCAAALIATLLVERASRIQHLYSDAALGLVYPTLFAAGAIIISMSRGARLDPETVLAGNVNLAVLPQLVIGDLTLGSRYLWVMGSILVVLLLLAWWHWQTVLLVSFDANYARVRLARAVRTERMILALSSCVVTAAFQGTGVMLTLAFVVAPPAIAHCLSSSVRGFFAVTLLAAAVGAFGGFWLAYALNAPTSATISVVFGVGVLLAAGWRQLCASGWPRYVRTGVTHSERRAGTPSITGSPPLSTSTRMVSASESASSTVSSLPTLMPRRVNSRSSSG